jgi:hypothetical protein
VNDLYAELKAPQSHKLLSDQVVRFDVRDFRPEPDATLHIEFHVGKKAVSR